MKTSTRVDGSSDQLEKIVSASYDKREVDGVDNLVGTYNFGPSDDAASGATTSIGEISLELVTPLNFKVECLWPAELTVELSDVDIATSNTVFDQGGPSLGSLDVSLALSGEDAITKKWTFGDTVTIQVDNNLDDQVNVVIGIEKCMAFSDASYTQNAVTISHGLCGAPGINAKADDVVNEYFTNTIEFDAFKYNAVSDTALDATAYVRCNLRVCLKDGDNVNDDCKNAASANQDSAKTDTDVDCPATEPVK